ncbi:hypothetical protein [Chamaesiphon sp. OTE_75_metabat_556]|uniref:hypothetical protein n=1 Tax=Chamaesiphon sp. OTE_75_metabat_556 TaxID=2964692 RepID=UPI00286AE85D|nr:hypothetical protein [Chamaesiphon sp. OTE_75_metabat_556]
MTVIPSLAFETEDDLNLDKAAYFALASWFPSPAIAAIPAKAAIVAVPAYPARAASAAIAANPDNLAIAAGALFANSPAIAAGAAVPAFPAKPATAEIVAFPAVPGVPGVPNKGGIDPLVLAQSYHKSTETNSEFCLFIPCNLHLEAMYGNKFKAVMPWIGSGNVNRVIADGVTLPAIDGVTNLEQLLYYYASLPDSQATINKVVVGGRTFFKIMKNAAFISSGGSVG